MFFFRGFPRCWLKELSVTGFGVEEPLTFPQLVRASKSGEEVFSIFLPLHCFFFGADNLILMVKN